MVEVQLHSHTHGQVHFITPIIFSCLPAPYILQLLTAVAIVVVAVVIVVFIIFIVFFFFLII